MTMQAQPQTIAERLADAISGPWAAGIDEVGLMRLVMQAKTALRRAVDDPGELHLQVGIALLQVRRTAQALEHLEASVRLDPEHPTALANLGAAYLILGRPGDAVEPLCRACDVMGDAAWASVGLLALLAEALWMVERRPEAVGVLEAAEAAASPTNDGDFWRLAAANSEIGEHVRAMVWLGKHLSAAGLEPELHPALGVPTSAWITEHQDEFRWTDAMLVSLDFVDGLVAAPSLVAGSTGTSVSTLRELGWLSAN